ncbi:kinase non-catalytic C-lobe domain-containing protein 1 [Gastrophryne carolinensis]
MEEVAEYYREEEDEEDGGGKELYEFQPLPTLLEDEENVSLADILSLRDCGLTEQDIWAICLECCFSMQDISHAAIFQTLCITPDTLAFNTSGNVCFMEQLSDDPEGAFVPPEFDLTGNTLEAHIYSLGATLKAAVEFVLDPDSQSDFSPDLISMLDCMQQESPAVRPDIQSIISLCEEKLNSASASLCRSLSSIGRRVLSIESVSAAQDGWESLWKGVTKRDNSIKEATNDKAPPNHIPSTNSSFFHNSTSSHEDEIHSRWRDVDFRIDKPCPSPNSFGHHLKKNKRAKSSSFEKFEAFDRAKVEDEIAKLSLKRNRKNKSSPAVSPVDKRLTPPNGEMATLKSWPSVPNCLSPNENMDDEKTCDNEQAARVKHVSFANAGLPSPNHLNCISPLGQSKCHSQVSYENLVTALEQESQQLGTGEISKFYVPKFAPLTGTPPNLDTNVLTSSQLFDEDVSYASRHLNSPELEPGFGGELESNASLEEPQWISLKDILINYGTPLQEDDLWALCHECLHTLSTYVDFPVILYLESVLLNHTGEVLFYSSGDEESYDAFCVPPEYNPDGDGVGTEKGCVYGIAAILWSAAKYNYPTNHKLALPKKLKRFLLQMAKRDSEERPSLDEALQFCRKMLLQKNLDSKAVWARLIALTEQTIVTSFIPVATHSKLMAVKGPVPLADLPANLPAAFTSPATYFKPIVLLQNTDANSCKISSPPSFTNQAQPQEIQNQIHSDRKETVPSAASSISSNSSTLTSSPIVNNYLLKQDPKTGNLTLVRVNLSIPDHIPTVVVNGETLIRKAASTPLQKVVQLLRDEFAFDGYLENGVEDIAMGRSLILARATFCSAICEKFCDLYWDEALLENLYKIINGKPPGRKPVAASSLDNSPARLLKKVQKKGRKHRKHGKPTASEQKSVAGDEPKTGQPQQPPGAEHEEDPAMRSSTGPEAPALPDTESCAPLDATEGIVEKDQMARTCEAPAENEEELACRTFSNCHSLCVSPDLSEENEEGLEDPLANQSGNASVSAAEVYRCGSGWSSAFYGAELFDPDVQHYVSILGRPKEKCSKSIEEKRLELEQQIMIETKNYRKTIKLYQNLIQKGKRNKGSEVKELLPKLKGNLEEMKSKVQFLELAKKLLQVSYAEQWGTEPRDLPMVAKLTSQEVRSTPEDAAFLLIYNDKGHSRDNTSKNLQAGTPLGLLAYLYCRNAVLDGYVQQFLYTFRYCCSQEELLQFLIDRIHATVPRKGGDCSSMNGKIYQRSLILLQTWIEDCWHIDFTTNQKLLDRLEDLCNSQSLPKDERGEHLMSLLQETSMKKSTFSSSGSGSDKREDTRSLHSLCSKFSEDTVSRKSFNWKLSIGNAVHIGHQRDKQYNISSALPRPCYPGFVEDLSSYYVKGEEGGTFSIHSCNVQQIASQLTLLQEEMFQKCHPVHFLNSRALGVKDKSSNLAKAVCVDSLAAEACSLFPPGAGHDKYLLQMLRFADNVSVWVAAEIVTCHTAKLQAGILTKFLLIAKLSYEQRDFATAIQILGGLEHLIVRQLPAWKNIPSKVSEILEELKAVEVFLKSDSLCLMKGDRFRTLPTIPSAYLLAMHVQQLETGGFTMANGAFKWSKLRNIAKVISQVHAFQEIPYPFVPDADLQFYLRQRILHFSDADIALLASDNNANFHHANSAKHSRKIQDTLRRMKATFQ